ncbi:uncharacterized protein PGTG_01764 [Puccinia graminis f. sp. tritici CRL 75-36-700-3]|uniref:Uncharacterized protein n=1 Tax=Puccinia graminis f. sp. tritici (strain CRL 75-36-700-3 / race SCCL) TaxID=418459 RepID=E3JSZ6_PUCGT|nr:uncharacterized protein PGTG_01764 [Puccinia graminis f. sp. tritici CRL 75-36-700-3]EFP75171.2 hypothetical protein PGTG_01764 [Puccinia graminis f. sp. tritici CRL 75-36-700-3]
MSDSEVSSDGELELSSNYDSDPSSSSSEASSISENGKPKPKSTKIVTTGSVMRLLDKLIEKFKSSMNARGKDSDIGLPQDEVDRKNDRLIDLEVDYLPTFKLELGFLLGYLGLQKDPTKHPMTFLDLTHQGLLDVEKSLDAIIECIEDVAFMPPAAQTDDHHYQGSKHFRTDYLMRKLWRLIENDIPELLSYYEDYISTWKSSNSRPSQYNCSSTRHCGGVIVKKTDYCYQFVDKIIHWCQASDFDILRDEWVLPIPKLDKLLETLTEKAHQDPANTQEVGRPARLARLTIPFVKLARTLITKVSNTKKKELPFSLDDELNTKTLHKLQYAPDSITSDLEDLTRTVLQSVTPINSLAESEAEIRRIIHERVSKSVDNFLTVLALSIIPLDPGSDRHSLESNYQDWFLTWKDMWDDAERRFLDALFDPDQDEEDVDDGRVFEFRFGE